MFIIFLTFIRLGCDYLTSQLYDENMSTTFLLVIMIICFNEHGSSHIFHGIFQ